MNSDSDSSDTNDSISRDQSPGSSYASPARDALPDIGECLQRGWDDYKREPWLLAGATLLTGVVNAIVGIIPFGGVLVASPLLAGLYMMTKRVSSGESVTIGNLFDGFKYFLPLVVSSIVIAVFVSIGVFLLVIPGLYLALAYSFTTLNIITHNMEFWPAMEHSRKTVNSVFWPYLGLGAVMVLILIAGSIPLGLGLLVAVPVCLGAQRHFYRAVDQAP